MSQGKNTEITSARSHEIDLLELLYVLIDKIRLIIAAAFVGAIIMAFYSFVLARPVYQATSKLYVLNQSDSAINLSDLQIGSYLTSDYQEVFDTWEVQQMVIENLGLSYTRKELREMVDIENPTNTRMLYIVVSSNDPAEAAQIANELAKVAQRYISSMMQTDEPSLMSQALEPIQPVKPRKALNICGGFAAGGLISALVIAVLYMIDDKLRTAEDIRQYGGLSTFAIVPVNTGIGIKSMSVGAAKPVATGNKRGTKA